ncbi:metal-dependent hydrolase family protein [Halopenitus persicus]|uniref:Imidazolonepropionase n=1 Tax=Halopenitus persicus TaxID=1048396 RepID=A0A1H3P456_9EURY|nr:amidohydrolase family protein [Halopenitus persicus]SDY95763.1 Imidazolonepropionase [Halopenitus persicus]
MGQPDLVLHGDVWDAKNGYRPSQWVTVSDGVLTTISSTEPDTSHRVHKVPFIMPGLIDMHVHLVWDGSDDPVASLQNQSTQETVVAAVENARKELLGGVTTVRDLGSTDDIAITLSSAEQQDQIANSPRILASGQTIIISGGHDPFWGIEVDGKDAVRSAVRTQRSKGADLIKVSATGGVYGQAIGEEPGTSELSLEELNTIVNEASRFNLQVAAHAVGTNGIRNAVDSGVDTVEHGNLMGETALETMVEDDIAIVPTLFTYRNIALNDSIPDYARTNAQGVYEQHLDSYQNALNAGVRVLAGSDAGSPQLPHPSLHRELDCMVKFGLDTTDALTSATLLPAEQLNRPELGVLEPETPADLVGFKSDPRDEITVTANPSLVMKEGEIYRTEKKSDVEIV